MDATQLSAIRADLAALQRMIDHGYEPQLTVAVEHGTALLDEVERLQAREVHFARVLRVPDGGEYLNDWDSRLTGLLDEVERLHTTLAAMTPDDPFILGDMDNMDSYCVGCGVAQSEGTYSLTAEVGISGKPLGGYVDVPHEPNCVWVAARAALRTDPEEK